MDLYFFHYYYDYFVYISFFHYTKKGIFLVLHDMRNSRERFFFFHILKSVIKATAPRLCYFTYHYLLT